MWSPTRRKLTKLFPNHIVEKEAYAQVEAKEEEDEREIQVDFPLVPL